MSEALSGTQSRMSPGLSQGHLPVSKLTSSEHVTLTGWRLIVRSLQSCSYRFHRLCKIPEKHRGPSAIVQNKQNLDQNVLK